MSLRDLRGTVGNTSEVGTVLLTLVLSVTAGYALGGRLSRLDRVPYRGLPLLALACASYLAGLGAALAGLPVGATYGPGLGAAAAGVLAFCLRSRAVAGTGLVGAGLLANTTAVAVNGGMPVSAWAARRAGLRPGQVATDVLHVPARAGTALRWLGDVVPAPLPFRPEVVSLGDLLIAAGLAQLVLTAMRPARWWPRQR